MEERTGRAFADDERLTVMSLPYAQAYWQDIEGVIHQALSAHREAQFGLAYGVWLKEWQLLQRAVFVINRADRLIYAEYVADQMREPDYAAAMEAACNLL